MRLLGSERQRLPLQLELSEPLLEIELDLAALVLMLLLKLLEWWLLLWLKGIPGNPAGVFFLAVADLLSLAINVFLVAILIQVILSWVSPGVHNPVSGLLWRLNEPLLGPARRLLPPISGLDLSPILVLVLLQLLKLLLVAPVRDLGRALLQ